MTKSLLGEKVAVLVANGFSEKDFVLSQKALLPAGADIRIIGMDNGLVNSWNAEGWGLNFAADQALNGALAADYDMLIVPGGQRSIEKLQLTAHTRRFIGGFVDAGKPVAFFDDALQLLLFSERGEGVSVAGPETLQAQVQEKGAFWSDESYVISGNVMTGLSNEDTREDYVQAVSRFLIEKPVVDDDKQAVAA